MVQYDLIERYYVEFFPMLSGYASKLGVRAASCSAVVNSAFTSLLERDDPTADFNDANRMKGLLFLIVLRRVLSRRRKSVVRRITSLAVVRELIATQGLEASDIAFARECESRLKGCLDDRQWEVFQRYLADETYAEIALAVDISTATVGRVLSSVWRIVKGEFGESEL